MLSVDFAWLVSLSLDLHSFQVVVKGVEVSRREAAQLTALLPTLWVLWARVHSLNVKFGSGLRSRFETVPTGRLLTNGGTTKRRQCGDLAQWQNGGTRHVGVKIGGLHRDHFQNGVLPLPVFRGLIFKRGFAQISRVAVKKNVAPLCF